MLGRHDNYAKNSCHVIYYLFYSKKTVALIHIIYYNHIITLISLVPRSRYNYINILPGGGKEIKSENCCPRQMIHLFAGVYIYCSFHHLPLIQLRSPFYSFHFRKGGLHPIQSLRRFFSWQFSPFLRLCMSNLLSQGATQME